MKKNNVNLPPFFILVGLIVMALSVPSHASSPLAPHGVDKMVSGTS